jgi:glycine hydroxymethyltransferase
MNEIREIFNLIKAHHEFMDSAIPLIASENVTSLAVRNALLSDFQHRYAEGLPNQRVYAGCEFIDEIELKAVKLAKELFNAQHVNVQPISGSVANLALYSAFTKPGDTIITLSVKDGGHITMNRVGLAGKLGLNVVNFPFDKEEFNIDVDRAEKVIRDAKPKLVLFGASVFLFPHPVRELRDVAKEVGAIVAYDASHVLGLIAGKTFQDPLREGVEVVTSSTHKTFPGPQHGIILSKAELAEAVDRAVFPGVVSNHHLHNVTALAIALCEMKAFGCEYARQIVKNAKALAEALADEGFEVVAEHKGFTESHQVLVDLVPSGLSGFKAERMLEQAGILVNRNLLPWDKERGRNFRDPSGIRIGVQEVTRLGMKEAEMEEIARFMADVLLRGRDAKEVAREVAELRKDFRRVEYSFDRGEAYRWQEVWSSER